MEEERTYKKQEFEPLQAIGIFWMVFGILILIGIFFSHTVMGKTTNGVCGGILLIVGIFSFLKGVINKKKRLES